VRADGELKPRSEAISAYSAGGTPTLWWKRSANVPREVPRIRLGLSEVRRELGSVGRVTPASSRCHREKREAEGDETRRRLKQMMLL
jgi:hypothetical protein